MSTVLCVCGESHLIPDADRVWFLHPSEREFALGLLDRGEPVVPCERVPRRQVINLDAKIARELIGTVGPHKIVEEVVFP